MKDSGGDTERAAHGKNASESSAPVWMSAGSAVALGASVVADAPAYAYAIVLGVAALVAMVSLLRVFRMLAALRERLGRRAAVIGRSHVLLHIVLFAYVAARLADADFQSFPAFWWPPAAAFFWTGRRTWSSLHRAFRSKMYYAFIRGNTGLLFMITLMTVLTFMAGPDWGARADRLMTGYAIIHIGLIGVAVRLIARDLRREREARGIFWK